MRETVPFAVLLAAPLVAFWLTRKALANPATDPAVRWFRFMRSFNLVVLGTWLGWIAALWLLDGAGPLRAAVGLGPDGGPIWVTVAVYLLPPGLVHALLTQVAFPVLKGVRGMDVSRSELLAQALWTQAVLVLPLLLLVAGADALRAGAPRQGVALFGAGGVAFLLASRRRARAMRLEPNALTEGELRDRVFALAASAGVRLRQLYVLPALKARMANALAATGNLVLLTDYLIENLSRPEVDAVVAHELAHLKRRHPLLLLVVAMTCIAVPVVSGLASGPWLPLAPLAAILVVTLVSRRLERSADAAAGRLTGNPEALITALVKLASLNLLPIHWGSLDEALLTHPSVRRRAMALARACGLSATRVDELLAAPPPAGDRYSLPASLGGRGPIFSTSFRREAAVLNTWAQILAATVTPALVLLVAGRAGMSWWLMAPTALAATALLMLVLANLLPPKGQRRIGRILAERLGEEGLAEVLASGVLVGFSPSGTPRLYETNISWDMGFLILAGDRLAFVGEQTRFALTRDAVTAVRLGPPYPGWWRATPLTIEWHDTATGSGGVFQVRPAAVSSLTEIARQATGLRRQVESWRQTGVAASGPLQAVEALGPPGLGEVTSLAPRQALRPVGCLVLAIVVAGIAGLLAVLLSLPPLATLTLLGVSGLAMLLLFVPVLLHRTPRAAAKASGA